jgi:hypothetical protein
VKPTEVRAPVGAGINKNTRYPQRKPPSRQSWQAKTGPMQTGPPVKKTITQKKSRKETTVFVSGACAGAALLAVRPRAAGV